MRRAAPAGVSCQGAPGAWTHPCKPQPCVRQGGGSSQACGRARLRGRSRPASERCARAGSDGRVRGQRHPSMLPCTATGARSRHWKVMRRMGARVVCSQRACARPGAAKAGRACAAARRRGEHRAGVTQCTPSSSIHTQTCKCAFAPYTRGQRGLPQIERMRADSVSHRAPPGRQSPSAVLAAQRPSRAGAGGMAGEAPAPWSAARRTPAAAGGRRSARARRGRRRSSWPTRAAPWPRTARPGARPTPRPPAVAPPAAGLRGARSLREARRQHPPQEHRLQACTAHAGCAAPNRHSVSRSVGAGAGRLHA